MKKTNGNTEGKLEHQLPNKAIELLKDSIGYNELAKFYESLFGKKNKGIEKKIAASVSVITLFFWLCKAIYFAYLSGVNCYYGVPSKYIFIDDNLEYQIFLYIIGVLIVGILTIKFMNIWLASIGVIKKVIKSIGLALTEMLVVYIVACLYTYGFQPMKVINEIKNYSELEIMKIIITFICMWIIVHCYGIATLVSNRTTQKHKICVKDGNKKKERRSVLLKSNILIMIVVSVSLVVGAWIYGWTNEMFRIEYNIVVCSSFDEENTDEEYIFEKNDKIYTAYVVISDTNDWFLCKRISNKYTISNGHCFIKKEGTEVFRLKEHFDKMDY